MNSSVPRGGAAQAGKGRPDIRLAWPLLEGEIRALQVDTTSHGCDRLAAGAAARLLPAADTEAAAPISTPLQPTPVLRVTVEGAAVPPGQLPPPAVTEGAALTSTHQRPTQLLRRTAEVAAVSRTPARAHPVTARPKGQQPQVQAVLPPVAVKGALQPRPQHPQLPRSRIQGTSDLIREVPNSAQGAAISHSHQFSFGTPLERVSCSVRPDTESPKSSMLCSHKETTACRCQEDRP